ncbi:MAG: type II toxin-antitoxin system Phd/YefM family antitoxin [Candidatus Nanopelagicales bacterium]
MSALPDDSTIGVFDLKSQLSSVLEEVIAGQVYTVTRHGHPIARITPISGSSVDERRAAAARMKDARRGRALGMPMKDAISQGRA